MSIDPANIPFPQVDDPAEMVHRIQEDIVRALRDRLGAVAVQAQGGTPSIARARTIEAGAGLSVSEPSAGVARIVVSGIPAGVLNALYYRHFVWFNPGSPGPFEFVTDVDGNPVFSLENLEGPP